MKKNGPAKEGPCGIPGYPSCDEELVKMAKKQGYNNSYVNAMQFSNTNSRPQNRGGYFLTKGGVDNAGQAETTKRISKFTNDPGYKALVSNSKARPVVSKIKQFIGRATGSNIRRKFHKTSASDYQVPNMSEVSNLLDIGRKYVGSKDITKDIGLIDKGKALYQGYKLLKKYPNLKQYAEKRNYL
jgi:hypothetical protein